MPTQKNNGKTTGYDIHVPEWRKDVHQNRAGSGAVSQIGAGRLTVRPLL
jgi:hypothetical protein